MLFSDAKHFNIFWYIFPHLVRPFLTSILAPSVVRHTCSMDRIIRSFLKSSYLFIFKSSASFAANLIFKSTFKILECAIRKKVKNKEQTKVISNLFVSFGKNHLLRTLSFKISIIRFLLSKLIKAGTTKTSTKHVYKYIKIRGK